MSTSNPSRPRQRERQTDAQNGHSVRIWPPVSRWGGAFRHTRQGVYRLKVCNASDEFLELDPARFGFIQFKARTGAIFKIERSRGRSPFSTSDPNQNGNRKRRHSDEQVFLRGIGGESLQGMEQNDGHVSLLKLVGSIVETASYKSGVIRLLLLTSREFLNSLQKKLWQQSNALDCCTY